MPCFSSVRGIIALATRVPCFSLGKRQHRFSYSMCLPLVQARSSIEDTLFYTCVLMLLHVSSYYLCVSSYSYLCVLILLYMCPHTRTYVSLHLCVRRLHMCPHTTTHMCPHTTVCVLILHLSSYYYMCLYPTTYVSSYSYLCVLILLPAYYRHTGYAYGTQGVSGL